MPQLSMHVPKSRKFASYYFESFTCFAHICYLPSSLLLPNSLFVSWTALWYFLYASRWQVRSPTIPQLPQHKELFSALSPYHQKLVGESYLGRRRPVYESTDVQVYCCIWTFFSVVGVITNLGRSECCIWV